METRGKLGVKDGSHGNLRSGPVKRFAVGMRGRCSLKPQAPFLLFLRLHRFLLFDLFFPRPKELYENGSHRDCAT